MNGPKNPALFYGAIVVAVIALAICIYYVMPGYYHVLASHDFTSTQPKHAIAAAAIAVICILAALVTRPRSSAR